MKRTERGESVAGFEEFWSCYPRKVGKGKCELLWRKIDPSISTFCAIIDALERQKQSHQWVKQGGQFIPHPSTWLAQKRWLDEPDEAGKPLEKKPWRQATGLGACRLCGKAWQPDGKGGIADYCYRCNNGHCLDCCEKGQAKHASQSP